MLVSGYFTGKKEVTKLLFANNTKDNKDIGTANGQ